MNDRSIITADAAMRTTVANQALAAYRLVEQMRQGLVFLVFLGFKSESDAVVALDRAQAHIATIHDAVT